VDRRPKDLWSTNLRRLPFVATESDPGGFWPDGVTFLDDISPAAWLGPRLLPGLASGLGTRVGAVVPTDYPAYVRILHPLGEGPDRPRWKDLVEAAGLIYHPLIQWDRLPLPLPAGMGHENSAPSTGDMAVSLRHSLITNLASETGTPDSVYYGIWEGYGYLHRGSSANFTYVDDPRPGHPRRQVSLEGLYQMVEGRPKFTLPGRAYLLAHGALDDLPLFPSHLTPSFIWPEDHAFCCATEIDFDSTLVGLSEQGAQRLLDDDSLEALPIGVNDTLDIFGDTINPGP